MIESHLMIKILQSSDVTLVEVTLPAGPTYVGQAKRAPGDKNKPAVAVDLALSRALGKASRHLERRSGLLAPARDLDKKAERVMARVREMTAGAELEGTCKVGDPDPTSGTSPYCRQWNEGYQCTRQPRHQGQHVAGGGLVVCHTWQDS